MKNLLLALTVIGFALALGPGIAASASTGTVAGAPEGVSGLRAPTYVGDWRMTIHAEDDGVDCGAEGSGFPCRILFDIRTNQPGWEGSDMYDVYATLDGQDLYADAGQTKYSEYDPDFYGVRAIAETDTLLSGVHTLILDWFYRGTWTCGPEVPNGCGYLGREEVRKVYKFRWHADGDQVVRPFTLPASRISVDATRKARLVKVSGVVKTQRLNADFEPTARYVATSGARVTLQSFSTRKRTWVSRTTVTSNRTGRVVATTTAPRVTKWRWVVKPTKTYTGSTSRAVNR